MRGKTLNEYLEPERGHTKRSQKVKNNRGQKTWRSKIKGGQEVKKTVETIYCNLPTNSHRDEYE